MLKMHKGAAQWERLLYVYVYAGPGNEAFVKGTRKIFLHSNAAAAGIDKVCRALHLPELFKADKPRRALIVWGVDRDYIGL